MCACVRVHACVCVHICVCACAYVNMRVSTVVYVRVCLRMLTQAATAQLAYFLIYSHKLVQTEPTNYTNKHMLYPYNCPPIRWHAAYVQPVGAEGNTD